MDTAPTSDPRLHTAVRASLAWYQDVFDAHRIATRCEDGLWRALAEPPRWHSTAKTLRPDVPTAHVLVVSGDDELAAWNTAQDTTGVLVPALLHHPRFTFLVRRSSGRLVAGAVLHRVDDAVELSNTWALGEESAESRPMLRCAGALYPGVAVVGYWRDDTLTPYTDAGFQAVGPHVVWVRDG